MDTQKLRCFVAVADKLSFTKAANELYFSVPTVTHHIKALEAELGVTLLIRDKHTVRLTPAGEAFYPAAREILDKLEQVTYRLTTERDFEVLRIGCTSHAEMVMLTPVFARFRRQYPAIRPDIFIENYDKVLDRFEEKELDLVFVTDNMLLRRKCARLFRPFCRMEAFAVVDEEHPLAGRERLAFFELEEQVLIRMSNSFVPFNTGNPLTRLIEVHGLQGRDIHCDDDRLMMSLAKAGYGVAILPGYCIPTYAEQIGLRCIPSRKARSWSTAPPYTEAGRKRAWRPFCGWPPQSSGPVPGRCGNRSRPRTWSNKKAKRKTSLFRFAFYVVW